MAPQFVLPLQVRHYEVDRYGFVHHYVYQHYLEEVAIQASVGAGFPQSWYDEHGTAFVIRHLTLEYVRPALIDDHLQIETWIAEWRRVRVSREYEIYRMPEHTLLLGASCDWVYLDRNRMFPLQIPHAVAQMLPGSGRSAIRPARSVPPLAPSGAAPSFVVRRQVQHHEIDLMGHVNNAVYVIWFDAALNEAQRELAPRDSSSRVCVRRRQLDYASGVLEGEEVEIVSTLVGVGRALSAWRQEVRRPGSAGPAVASTCLALRLNELGRPQTWRARV